MNVGDKVFYMPSATQFSSGVISSMDVGEEAGTTACTLVDIEGAVLAVIDGDELMNCDEAAERLSKILGITVADAKFQLGG